MTGQLLGFAIKSVSVLVLARLLTPRDFGLFGMALVVTALADQLRTMGLSQATIQSRDLGEGQLSTMFWLNALMGAALMAAVGLSAPLVARFFSEPELTWVLGVLSVQFLMSGLSIQHSALLTRQLRFRSLALRMAVPKLVGVVVGVVMAFLGHGYWSLVAASVVSASVTTLLLWTLSSWRPRLLPHWEPGTWALVRFGLHVSGSSLLTYAARNADNILVGRYLGATSLGLYTRGYSLLLAPIRQVNGPMAAVFVPLLSRLQDEPHRYRRLYLSGLNALALASCPCVLTLVVISPEFVVVLLGEQWRQAGVIFGYLGAAAFCQVLTNTTGWLYLSRGNSRAMLAWSLWTTPITVASFALGLPWGATGVAGAYALSQVLLSCPAFWVACRNTPVSMADVVGVVWRPLCVASAVGMAALGAAEAVRAQQGGEVVVVVAALATALLVWSVLLLVWKSPQRDLVAVVRLLRQRRGRDRANVASS